MMIESLNHHDECKLKQITYQINNVQSAVKSVIPRYFTERCDYLYGDDKIVNINNIYIYILFYAIFPVMDVFCPDILTDIFLLKN